MTITELAVKKPTVVAVIFIILCIFGIASYNKLNYELLPKFQVPLLVINTVYPGASAEAIETQVTKKIENNISSLQHIKRIRSTSYENLSVIAVELVSGTDVDVSLEDCQRKLNTVIPDLPEGARTPTISKVSNDDFPVLKYSVSSNIVSNIELTQFLKDKIVPQITGIKDVAGVSLIGVEDKAIRVNVDAEKLKAYSLSILNVTQAITANNLDFPTGRVEDATNSLRIKLTGKYENVTDLENLVIIHTGNGGDVKLKDVAVVVEDKKTVETISRINGKPSIEIAVTKQSDANAVQMAEAVKKNLNELQKIYGARNLKFHLVIDTTEFTLQAADDVQKDLGIALLLVALVILLFLHSIRDSFIVMLAIPSSFMGTLISVYLFGYTLNLMTLLGLTLVVGILVDDSIVVLENIHRHLHMGKNKLKASIDGRNEIGPTAIAITMVDVIVFLPLALSHGGIVSPILRPFAWVIIISTLLSLFVSFTLTPLLASRVAGLVDLTKNNVWARFNRFIEKELNALTDWYGRRLAWVDSCSLWNIISSTLLLAATLQSKCFFSITKFVEYECLFKSRKGLNEREQILINKLQSLLTKQTVSSFSLSIADLQEVELMQNRKKLGLGELSSIAFAKRTNQVFLTDDQKARKFAKKILGNSRVQTTPHLYGWLLFNQHLNESDLTQILDEHNFNNRPLEPYFREAHQECLRIKSMLI